MLEVLHDLFEEQTNLDNVLLRIMQKAQTLLKCQRCSILLNTNIDPNMNDIYEYSFHKAFDLFQNDNNTQRRHRFV